MTESPGEPGDFFMNQMMLKNYTIYEGGSVMSVCGCIFIQDICINSKSTNIIMK